MIFLDEVLSWGHPNVLSTHRTTLEITKEDFLTVKGDCIISINANKAVSDYNVQLKNAIQEGKQILVLLKAGPYEDQFIGYGNKELSLKNSVSMVFRKSEFISDRTALISCNKASKHINRDLVAYLQSPNHQLITQFYLLNYKS